MLLVTRGRPLPQDMVSEKALREFTLLRNAGAALFAAAFTGPSDEAAHARAFAPHETKETTRVKFAGFRAKERFHAPLDIGTFPRPQTIAFRDRPVVTHSVQHGRDAGDFEETQARTRRLSVCTNGILAEEVTYCPERPPYQQQSTATRGKKQILRSPLPAASLRMKTRCARFHFAAAIEATSIMSPLSVPVTVTFSPAKARGLA